jgi:hypothetical protein
MEKQQCRLVGIFVELKAFLNACTSSTILTALYPHPEILWRIFVAGNNTAYFGLHIQYLIFLLDFHQIFIFSTDFHKGPPVSNFTEIRQAGAEMIMRADGQTYRS